MMSCPVCKVLDTICQPDMVKYLRWSIQECYLETEEVPTLIAIHPRIMRDLIASGECLRDIESECRQVWLDGVLVIEQIAGNELLRSDSVVIAL
jgi:hypothetical protein